MTNWDAPLVAHSLASLGWWAALFSCAVASIVMIAISGWTARRGRRAERKWKNHIASRDARS
jgi:hypothetical protein